MKIVRVINIDPDCWHAGIVNNSRSILTVLHKSSRFALAAMETTVFADPVGIGGNCSVPLVISQALIDRKSLQVLFFHDK